MSKLGYTMFPALPEETKEELGDMLRQAKTKLQQAKDDAKPWVSRVDKAWQKVREIETKLYNIEVVERRQKEVAWMKSAADPVGCPKQFKGSWGQKPSKTKEKLPYINLNDFT